MEKSPIDVTVIGNIGIDTNVYLNNTEIDFSVESNFTENIDNIGQAGGYSCRGYARLGKRVAFIGYLGDDYHGDYIRREFIDQRIDSSAIFIDPQGTSRSINIMYKDGRRKNFYDGKDHMTLQPDLNTCRQVLARARVAHFNIPNWARSLLPIAKELGLKTACDLQDVVQVDDPYRQDFIHHADILFASAVNHADQVDSGRANKFASLQGDVRAECALPIGNDLIYCNYAQTSKIRCPWGFTPCDGAGDRGERDLYKQRRTQKRQKS